MDRATANPAVTNTMPDIPRAAAGTGFDELAGEVDVVRSMLSFNLEQKILGQAAVKNLREKRAKGDLRIDESISISWRQHFVQRAVIGVQGLRE